MSLLNSLNLIKAVSSDKADPVSLMRRKLLERIADQIALAKAQAEGAIHQRLRFRRVKDPLTGDVTYIPAKSRIRPWWQEQRDGSVLLTVKYGSRPLDLQNGKAAIKASSFSEVVPTLEVIQTAVRAGELDAQILRAAEEFRVRFKGGDAS